jgi:predicted DNA-binding transcriptional regulator AlpA
MTEHNFTLIIQGDLTDNALDTFYKMGCDDATFSTKDGLTFAEFDREASTLIDAVASALADIEAVDGYRVLHVTPDDLVWASEIAERIGRTRQSIDLLIKGQRGPNNFPAPVSHATRNPLWRWSEVEDWFAVYEGREPTDSERSAVLEAVNGALSARHGLHRSTESSTLRKVVGHLIDV